MEKQVYKGKNMTVSIDFDLISLIKNRNITKVKQEPGKFFLEEESKEKPKAIKGNVVKEIGEYYLKKGQDRNYLLFVLGLNTGIRVSDFRLIQAKFLVHEDMKTPRDALYLMEGKTKKKRKITLNTTVKNTVKWYFNKHKEVEYEDYVFGKWAYRKKNDGSGEYHLTYQPISDRQINRILHQACEAIGIDMFSFHTFRRTLGNNVGEGSNWDEKTLMLLSMLFNHSSMAVTKRYLGITDREVQELYGKLEYDLPNPEDYSIGMNTCVQPKNNGSRKGDEKNDM